MKCRRPKGKELDPFTRSLALRWGTMMSRCYNQNRSKYKDYVLVDSSFSLFDYPVFKPYIESVTPEIIESVENWLRTAKNGQHVTIGFITRQFTNFANRQNKPIFKK